MPEEQPDAAFAIHAQTRKAQAFVPPTYACAVEHVSVHGRSFHIILRLLHGRSFAVGQTTNFDRARDIESQAAFAFPACAIIFAPIRVSVFKSDPGAILRINGDARTRFKTR